MATKVDTGIQCELSPKRTISSITRQRPNPCTWKTNNQNFYKSQGTKMHTKSNAYWNGHGTMKGLIMFVPYTHIAVQVVKLIYRYFWEFLTFFDSCNLSLLMGSLIITRTQEVETLLKNTREVQENLSITKTVQVLKIWATMAFAQSVWKEWERSDTLPHKALLGT